MDDLELTREEAVAHAQSLTMEELETFKIECFARFVIAMGKGAKAPNPPCPTWEELGNKFWPARFRDILRAEVTRHNGR